MFDMNVKTEMQDVAKLENVRQLSVMFDKQLNLPPYDLQSDMIPKF
jgi:hypothetical protein